MHLYIIKIKSNYSINIFMHFYKIFFLRLNMNKMVKKSNNYGTLKIDKQQSIHKMVDHIHYLSKDESLEAVSLKYNIPVNICYLYSVYSQSFHA